MVRKSVRYRLYLLAPVPQKPRCSQQKQVNFRVGLSKSSSYVRCALELRFSPAVAVCEVLLKQAELKSPAQAKAYLLFLVIGNWIRR